MVCGVGEKLGFSNQSTISSFGKRAMKSDQLVPTLLELTDTAAFCEVRVIHLEENDLFGL